MSDQSMQEEILNQLVNLPPEQQRRVLEFARSLRESIPIGKPGNTLLRFAGAIEEADLSMMAQAIKEGCEQVNQNEW
jgi:hypothetical protein